MKVNLKRVLAKKEIVLILSGLAESPFMVRDAGGNLVFGNPGGDYPCAYPIDLDGEDIGWVYGQEKASALAPLISYMAATDRDKKALGRETLEKYKEITLLYNVTEKLAGNLDPTEVARLIVYEVKRLIKADNVSVMKLNEETGCLEIMAGSGKEYYPKANFRPGEGIAGSIMKNGRAEIINDVHSDPRFVSGAARVSSLICAPLKIKENVIGVINVSSIEPANYKAEDLKILSSLSLQAAVAIENSKLFFIRDTFGRYLSDEVVSRLLEHPGALSLGGEKKLVTILMSDLRGFTSITEHLSPETVVAVLNNYLSKMVDIIQQYHGTILEFIGDAIMAVFGAPFWTEDHASLAVACAIEMQAAMKSVNRWNAAGGYPEMEMGIGINTGQVIIGNIGSEKRTKYGCVGSQVNITSRIESYTVGGQIFAPEETLRASPSPLRCKDRLETNPKGFHSPIVVYDIVGIGDPYNLFLEESKPDLVRLEGGVPVQISVIMEKHTVGDHFGGTITKLSLKEAEIQAEREIATLVNIRLQVLDLKGAVLIDDIYAKTKQAGESSRLRVQFTSLTPEGRDLLNGLIKGREASL